MALVVVLKLLKHKALITDGEYSGFADIENRQRWFVVCCYCFGSADIPSKTRRYILFVGVFENSKRV